MSGETGALSPFVKGEGASEWCCPLCAFAVGSGEDPEGDRTTKASAEEKVSAAATEVAEAFSVPFPNTQHSPQAPAEPVFPPSVVPPLPSPVPQGHVHPVYAPQGPGSARPANQVHPLQAPQGPGAVAQAAPLGFVQPTYAPQGPGSVLPTGQVHPMYAPQGSGSATLSAQGHPMQAPQGLGAVPHAAPQGIVQPTYAPQGLGSVSQTGHSLYPPQGQGSAALPHAPQGVGPGMPAVPQGQGSFVYAPQGYDAAYAAQNPYAAMPSYGGQWPSEELPDLARVVTWLPFLNDPNKLESLWTHLIMRHDAPAAATQSSQFHERRVLLKSLRRMMYMQGAASMGVLMNDMVVRLEAILVKEVLIEAGLRREQAAVGAGEFEERLAALPFMSVTREKMTTLQSEARLAAQRHKPSAEPSPRNPQRPKGADRVTGYKHKGGFQQGGKGKHPRQ